MRKSPHETQSLSKPAIPVAVALGVVAVSGAALHPAVLGAYLPPLAAAAPVVLAALLGAVLVLPKLRAMTGAMAETLAERDGARTREARLKSELEVSENALEKAEVGLAIAEEQAQAKAHYLSAISQEVRTPLNGVIGMSDLMAETRLDDEQTALVETVRQSAEALQSVLSNVLDFSALETGDLVLEDMPYDIREVAEDALRSEAAMARKKGLELVFDAPPDLMTHARGDPKRVRQMIALLVSNAVKFTERGEVVLSLRNKERGGTNEMQVRVADTGIGIAKDDLDRVFKPFERAELASKRRFAGPGLGLSIAQKLARLMGGSLTATSEWGAGSEFTLKFAHRVRQTARGLATEAPDLSGQRHLVLDDSRAAVEVLKAELTAMGAEVVAATGLEEGEDVLWEAMANGPKFRAMWLDMSLPGVDALALAARISDKIEDIPLVLMTAQDPRGLNDAVEKGIGLSVLEKPFQRSRMRSVLTKIDAHWVAEGGETEVRAENAPQRPTSVSLVSGLQPACIILADDNATNRILIEKFLADEPMTLIHAPDGVGAVQSFEDWAPDLILMDVSMPRMDGLEATRRIRAAEKAQGLGRVPIIALTARAMPEDREKCIVAGMDDYVTKPIRKTELKSKITEWTVARRKSA